MLYRMRFDNNVGSILKSANLSTNDIIDFWPVGATAEHVKSGQALGLSPLEAATLGVAYVTKKRSLSGQIRADEAQYIINQAQSYARRQGARQEILSQLTKLMLEV